MGFAVAGAKADRSFASDARGVIEVYGGPADTSAVAKLLERLNCTVRRCGREAPDPSPDRGRAAAAIVVERDADVIALCAALSAERTVILVSERTDFEFRLSAARAGIGALLRPPVNPIELSEWLVHFGLIHTPARPTSVVVVDDDYLTAELSAEILRSVGMTVDTVCDPRLALRKIEARLPDLVLMDMQMPGVGGVELARMIRQVRQFVSLPIVFLSVERDEQRQFEARRLGGDDFLTKPIVPEKLISVIRMRAERARLLRAMIERDGLTGLFDHRRFKERLSQELERCSRTGAELSLAMVDIDRFKTVNDTHGHAAGDVVIRTLASDLLSALRAVDIVGRYGGEEFGIIMPDTDPQAARIVMDRVRRGFARRPIQADDATFMVTFSGGIASSRDHADMPGLIEAADRALYGAKAAGRDNVQTVGQRSRFIRADGGVRTSF